MHAHKEGFILILVMMFLIAATAAAVGLYMSVTSTHKVVAVEELERIKGYYAAMSGVRYAYILLEDPNIIAAIPNENDSVTRSIMQDCPWAVSHAMCLKDPHDVRITITNRGNAGYDVSASYNL